MKLRITRYVLCIFGQRDGLRLAQLQEEATHIIHNAWKVNFNHSLLDSRGAVSTTEADLLNRATLGLQAMHAPNTHHFPIILSGGEPVSVS